MAGGKSAREIGRRDGGSHGARVQGRKGTGAQGLQGHRGTKRRMGHPRGRNIETVKSAVILLRDSEPPRLRGSILCNGQRANRFSPSLSL